MSQPLTSTLRKTSESLAQICVPRPPLLTSLATQWQTISMAYMHQPTHEFSQVCLSCPFIAVCFECTY